MSARSKCSTVGTISSTASRSTRSGWSIAIRCDTRAPRSCATTWNRSWPKCAIVATRSFAISRLE